MDICLYYCFFLLVSIEVFSILVDSSPEISARKHVFFPDFSLHNNSKILHDLKLLGSAKLSNEKRVIQIPDDSQATDLRHQAGRAIYSSPVRLLDPVTKTPTSFETTFSFQFNTSNNTRTSRDGGSSLTFIIVPDEFTVGRAGPWLGVLNDACKDDYKAVAVKFDTCRDLEFGGPNDNHVGINLGSIVSTRAINASDVGIFLNDGSVHRAWIAYDGTRASTGNMTQIHNLLSWNFSSISQPFLLIPSTETCENNTMLQQIAGAGSSGSGQHRQPEPAHGFLIFIVVSVLALVIFLAMYCISRRQRKDIALPGKKQRPRPPNKPRRFTLSEISVATRAFSELECLGSDYRGVYYRGKLPNGRQPVAGAEILQHNYFASSSNPAHYPDQLAPVDSDLGGMLMWLEGQLLTLHSCYFQHPLSNSRLVAIATTLVLSLRIIGVPSTSIFNSLSCGMYTFSVRSPFKKALFMSTCLNIQPLFTAMVKTILIVAALTTRLKSFGLKIPALDLVIIGCDGKAFCMEGFSVAGVKVWFSGELVV
ncbi:L-type lectin-domain containing receptor kinase VIII.2 [Citrus sinensis]|uniref:L-type lectin-domain containing receptor kinase VIII.2 n=1 Tax=Citrus sinensis TaxID=2711 RepID=A0ACB8M406_CITSI|nr:L-type lectin-domain containing receptor kinase VIII.2 [Citrus sinensis]